MTNIRTLALALLAPLATALLPPDAPAWGVPTPPAPAPSAFAPPASAPVASAPVVSAPLNYRLDAGASNVTAKVSFFGISSKTARFPRMEGRVTIVPGKPQDARINVTFDTTAIEAPDSTTLSRLRGEKFFWVEKYPQVRFVGERLDLTGATRGTVKGWLTARGVTRPAMLDIAFDTPPLTSPREDPVSFTGTTTIDRREFGMKSYQLIVGNNVEITLRARMLPG